MNNLTQSELKEILHYDLETGVFTRIKDIGCKIKKGCEAGCVNNADGYIDIQINRKSYKAHRLAWFYVYGVWPEQIDHINHIRANNRFINLRESNYQENSKNKSKQKNNVSGFTGVSWNKKDKRWHAQISVNKNPVHLGNFKSKEKAIAKREMANILYGFHENHGL